MCLAFEGVTFLLSSVGGKPSSKPGALPSPASKVQEPINSTSTDHGLPKSTGTPMATQSEVQRPAISKGTKKSTGTTAGNTAGHGHNVGAEEKRVVEVEGEIKEENEATHSEGNNVANIHAHNPAGQPEQVLSPGNDINFKYVFQDRTDSEATADWTSIPGLEDWLEAAKQSYTHANVVLKYMYVDSRNVPPENTFITSLSQCHKMICAQCSYTKCSHVEFTAHLLNMRF